MGLLGPPRTLGSMAPFFTEVIGPRPKNEKTLDTKSQKDKEKGKCAKGQDDGRTKSPEKPDYRRMQLHEPNHVREAQATEYESDEQTQEPDHIREAQARAEIEADKQGQDNADDAIPDSREAQIESQDNGSVPRPSGDRLPPPETQADLRVILNKKRDREVEITPENIDSIIQENEMSDDLLAETREKLIRGMRPREEKVRRTQGQEIGPTQTQAEDACPDLREVLNQNKRRAKSQDDGSTLMQSKDKHPSPEAQADLRDTLNERREQEVEITSENIDSIILETVEKEPDLRTDNIPTAEEGETNQQEEPRTEMSNVVRHELSPETWPRPLRAAVYKERDDDRPMTPPSPIPPRRDDPEMIPQTPPREQNSKKTHSPITFNNPQEDTPRRPPKMF